MNPYEVGNVQSRQDRSVYDAFKRFITTLLASIYEEFKRLTTTLVVSMTVIACNHIVVMIPAFMAGRAFTDALIIEHFPKATALLFIEVVPVLAVGLTFKITGRLFPKSSK